MRWASRRVRTVVSNEKDGFQRSDAGQENINSMVARVERTDMRQRHACMPMYVSRELFDEWNPNHPGTTPILRFSSTLR
jgi:hypothetical protein